MVKVFIEPTRSTTISDYSVNEADFGAGSKQRSTWQATLLFTISTFQLFDDCGPLRAPDEDLSVNNDVGSVAYRRGCDE